MPGIFVIVISGTFSCRPTSLSLFYSTVSCEGELRNRKKYAELAYFKTISGNSGVQKRLQDGRNRLGIYRTDQGMS